MNPADIRAQLESDLTWRLNEVRDLRNIMQGLDDEGRRMTFRKALIVMLYAHFEGYCKAALTAYVRAVNQEQLDCGELCDALAAAALTDVFRDLNSNRKSDIFQRDLPNDEQLHRAARRIDFVASYPKLMSRKPAVISEELVDAEANLKPIVLRKNLYQLGFDPLQFVEQEGIIHQLLKRRNDVAHGSAREGITAEKYDEIEASAHLVMNELTNVIFEALVEQRYKRTRSAA